MINESGAVNLTKQGHDMTSCPRLQSGLPANLGMSRGSQDETIRLLLTVVHEGILHLRTGESDVAEIVEHVTGTSCVDKLTETQISDPVKERKNVRTRLGHRHEYNTVILLGVIRENGDHEIGVQGVQVGSWLVQDYQHWKKE